MRSDIEEGDPRLGGQIEVISGLEKALKILASATCFGIYAQLDRQGEDDKVEVTCHGIDPDPYKCKVAHPEFAGEFCFPPLASLITADAKVASRHRAIPTPSPPFFSPAKLDAESNSLLYLLMHQSVTVWSIHCYIKLSTDYSYCLRVSQLARRKLPLKGDVLT
jgi:hypothetical protein